MRVIVLTRGPIGRPLGRMGAPNAHVTCFIGGDLVVSIWSESAEQLRCASSRLMEDLAAGARGTLVLEGVVRGIPRQHIPRLCGDLEAAAAELDDYNAERVGASC